MYNKNCDNHWKNFYDQLIDSDIKQMKNLEN